LKYTALLSALSLAPTQLTLDRLANEVGAILVLTEHGPDPLERPSREAGLHVLCPSSRPTCLFCRHPIPFNFSYAKAKIRPLSHMRK
jgi:hypothetical protein